MERVGIRSRRVKLTSGPKEETSSSCDQSAAHAAFHSMTIATSHVREDFVQGAERGEEERRLSKLGVQEAAVCCAAKEQACAEASLTCGSPGAASERSRSA